MRGRCDSNARIPGRDVFEDRALQVISEIPVDFLAQIRASRPRSQTTRLDEERAFIRSIKLISTIDFVDDRSLLMVRAETL